MAEIVDVVDAENQVLRSVPRHVMRAQNLFHRASFIVIHDRNGFFYVQKRTPIKDYCPSMFDACCGGVMQSGEDATYSAYRELEEEMGIRNTPLKELGWFQYHDENNHVWGALFSCEYEGELQLQESEVEFVVRMSFDEIMLAGKLFTPDSLYALKIWRESTTK